MAQCWASQMNQASHLPSEYFSLHQQRRYLLENLASQESRGERLANLLEVTKAKLDVAKNSGNGADNIKPLKKTLKNLAYKLSCCQKSEKSLASNLALLTARMNFMEQTQWRRANIECNQFFQYCQLDELSTRMQNMRLVSLSTPGFRTPSYNSNFVSPATPTLIRPWTSVYSGPLEIHQLMSQTPILQPYGGLLHGQFGSGHPDPSIPQYGDVFDTSDTTMEIDTEMSPLHLPVRDFVPAQRASSLPDITTQNAPHSVEQIRGTGGTEKRGTAGLTRHMSLVDHGSSALRLQRKFP